MLVFASELYSCLLIVALLLLRRAWPQGSTHEVCVPCVDIDQVIGNCLVVIFEKNRCWLGIDEQ
jgi:hypothetical protein